LQRRDRSGE
jgi:hypothetical protein